MGNVGGGGRGFISGSNGMGLTNVLVDYIKASFGV